MERLGFSLEGEELEEEEGFYNCFCVLCMCCVFQFKEAIFNLFYKKKKTNKGLSDGYRL
jgi:hypothetical protein